MGFLLLLYNLIIFCLTEVNSNNYTKVINEHLPHASLCVWSWGTVMRIGPHCSQSRRADGHVGGGPSNVQTPLCLGLALSFPIAGINFPEVVQCF